MFYSIQIHRHTDAFSHEIIIKHVTYHYHAMHVHHLFSSHSDAEGYAVQQSFASWCPKGTQPTGLSFHSAKGYATQWSCCMVPKGMQPKSL
jgi:hypothetical protein